MNPCLDSKLRSSGIHGKYKSVHTVHYMLDWCCKSYKIVEQLFHILNSGLDLAKDDPFEVHWSLIWAAWKLTSS